MSNIAVIGIAGESVFLSVDAFGVTGETTVAHAYHSELGGKGFNQAVAAARYGAEVCFLAAAHTDDAVRFTQIASAHTVNARFIAKPTRSPYAVIMTDKDGDNRVCVYHGAELDVADVCAFEQEIAQADLVLINNETPISVNQKVVELAQAHGTRVILNPAPARRYDHSFLEQIDLFTPNEHETEGLEQFPNVVVTLGSKGCLIRSTGEHIPAVQVSLVADTTGAGDTFNGVLAACLAEGKSLKAACEAASIASAIKVGRKYILDSIPDRKEIDDYQNR